MEKIGRFYLEKMRFPFVSKQKKWSNIGKNPSAKRLFSYAFEGIAAQAYGKKLPLEEQEAMARQLLEHFTSYTLAKEIAQIPIAISPEAIKKIESAIDRIGAGEPLQYILERSYFLGNCFHTPAHVLIPRPSTEAMVDALQNAPFFKKSKHILDIGTGSGCIAISLAKKAKEKKVTAIDICPYALAIAKKNGTLLKTENIEWALHDILKDKFSPKKMWDLIISNPPYIPLDERESMAPHVKEKEPFHALFVPNNKPLLFYEKIAEIGKKHLVEGGHLVVEVHARLAANTKNLLTQWGYKNLTIGSDLEGFPRWIIGEK